MGKIASKHLRTGTDRRSRLIRGVCVLALVGALAGCAGRSAPAPGQHTGPPARPGAAATSVGGIELQFVRLERPAGDTHAAGSDVGLYLTIVNRRTSDDRLRAVTTPDAKRVVVRDGVNSPARSVDLRLPKHATISLQHPDKTHLELSALEHELRPGTFVPVLFSLSTRAQ